jgi:hypothetical protein
MAYSLASQIKGTKHINPECKLSAILLPPSALTNIKLCDHMDYETATGIKIF